MIAIFLWSTVVIQPSTPRFLSQRAAKRACGTGVLIAAISSVPREVAGWHATVSGHLAVCCSIHWSNCACGSETTSRSMLAWPVPHSSVHCP